MSTETHAILTSSDEPNWRSPRWLTRALDREFGIHLDAAADSQACCASSLPGAWLGPGGMIEDGLDPNWSWGQLARVTALTTAGAPVGLPVVFCNPPYRRGNAKKGIPAIPIEPWIERMALEGREAIVLGVIPYAPQTRHWRRYVAGDQFRATEIRKFPFRLKFDPPEGWVNKAKDGKAHGANVNTAVCIWRPTGEYPRSLPWAPFERYWVPQEMPKGAMYHKPLLEELAGDEDTGDEE